jgi:hypothetical protein
VRRQVVVCPLPRGVPSSSGVAELTRRRLKLSRKAAIYHGNDAFLRARGMTAQVEIEGAWEFVINDARLWEWRTVHPTTREDVRRSAAAFETLMQCVSDAAKHGYERRTDRSPPD